MASLPLSRWLTGSWYKFNRDKESDYNEFENLFVRTTTA